MTIEYKMDENDFLTHQLFAASKSDQIKKKRQRSKIIVPIIYLAFGLLLLFENKISVAVIFIIIGLLWFFIYPLWQRQRYISHYKKFIKENHKDELDKIVTLELNNDFVLAKDNGSENKVRTTEIKEINEISSIILIRLKGDQSFLLPKDKITNMDNVRTKLKELADYLKIKYEIDENWKWK
jgi:hypothetical protein